MAAPKVIFVMSDYGHDPTETAVPFQTFQEAGFQCFFVTETGKAPECDKRMLEGMTQKLLGADATAIKAYKAMRADPAMQHPQAWTKADFSLADYDLLFFPGGHDKGVRQAIESSDLKRQIADYFPHTKKPGNKAIAAICHGVLAVSEAAYDDGTSLLHDVATTTLPGTFESGIYQTTRLFLGDYYKTYGAGSENVEDMVKKRLGDPKAQFKGSLSMSPFVVEDETYNYVSGRFPPDAELLAKKAIALVKSVHGAT